MSVWKPIKKTPTCKDQTRHGQIVNQDWTLTLSRNRDNHDINNWANFICSASLLRLCAGVKTIFRKYGLHAKYKQTMSPHQIINSRVVYHQTSIFVCFYRWVRMESYNCAPLISVQCFFLLRAGSQSPRDTLTRSRGRQTFDQKHTVVSCLVDDFMDPDFVSVWFYLQPETKFFFSLQIAIYRVFNGQWVINKLSCLRSGPPANKSERPSVNKRATDQLGLGGLSNFGGGGGGILKHSPTHSQVPTTDHHSLANDDCFDEQTHLAIHKSLGADTASISFRLSTE